MKELRIANARQSRQSGFTIIELIVVILLLGILTATALPRFLDISDDAHGAVVDAVEGSLRSGLALYRAGWVANGQNVDAALASYGNGNLWPDDNATGYPADATDGVIDANATDCLAVFDGIVDLGGMTSAGVAAPHGGTNVTENPIETAAAGNDWVVAPNDATTPTGCIFYYTGQFKSGDTGTARTIRTLTYTLATGAIGEGTETLDQDT